MRITNLQSSCVISYGVRRKSLQSLSIIKMMRLLTPKFDHGHFLKLTRHMKPSTMRKK